jgi:flagellar biosynthesis GTPase FlhF
MDPKERDELFFRMRNHTARHGRARPIQLESMTQAEIEAERVMKAERLRDTARRCRKNKKERLTNLEELVKRQRDEIKEKNRRIHDLERDLNHYKELSDKLVSQINPEKNRRKQEVVQGGGISLPKHEPSTRNTVQVFFPQQPVFHLPPLDIQHPSLDSQSLNLPADLQSIQIHSDFHSMNLPLSGDFRHPSLLVDPSESVPDVTTEYYRVNKFF